MGLYVHGTNGYFICISLIIVNILLSLDNSLPCVPADRGRNSDEKTICIELTSVGYFICMSLIF